MLSVYFSTGENVFESQIGPLLLGGIVIIYKNAIEILLKITEKTYVIKYVIDKKRCKNYYDIKL
ncbi:hypothetical protein DWX43_06960 [Clostridium sp. AF19-22AC]|nr:hypothetical protein DWX43_06960 [Clostridium sp. AF19-22AC]